jgi:type IV pilus assembly protein PilM
MATPKFAWGIDIGNRALKAVKLVSSAEGLVIDDFDVIEHEGILSSAGDNRESMIQSALAQFVQRHPGIDKGQVGVGVTGQQSFARFIKLPPVEPKKIPEIVRFEAIQQIPFPLDEVEWSYQLFQDPESPDVEVGIFAMRKDLVNQHIKFFTDAKLNVQAVQMNPLAVYNAMYYDSRIKGTTMMIDVGAENTDLIIAEGETIWMRSISIGGNNFTEALTKAFKVNFAKAEDLKRNASTSKYGRQIMQAMRPIFADLVSEIQRSIGFYSSVHKESRISKVVAIGSTFRLPGLQKYLSQNLTLDVEKLDRLGTGSTGGAMEDAKIAASLSDNLLSAAGAYGLALQVMGQGKISSSLLPERIRREKMWAEKTKWFVGAAALFMVGAAIPYARWYWDNSQFTNSDNVDLVTKIGDVQRKATANDAAWQTIESAGATEKVRMNNIRDISRDKDLWAKINTLIYNTLPQNAPGAQKELSSADPDVIKKIKRGDRNQIVMDAMVQHYVPEINLLANEDIAGKADLSVNVIPLEGAGGGAYQGGGSNYAVSPGQGAAPTGPAAKPQRGFIITMKLTTPNSGGATIINKFNSALLAFQPTVDLPFTITQATIVDPMKIKEDKAIITAMTSAWLARERQKALDDAAANGGGPGAQGGAQGGGPGGGPRGLGGGPGMPGGGGGMPGGGGMYGGGGMPGGMGMGGGGRGMPTGGGGMFGGPGGAGMPGAAGGNTTEKVPDEAFFDPVLREDIRDDTECTVVFTLVIDVPVTVPAAPAAPPAPGKNVAAASPSGPGASPAAP